MRGGLAPPWSRESGAQPGSVEGWVSHPRTQRLSASGNISFSGGPPQAGGRRVKRPGPNVQTGQGRFLWPYGLGCRDAGPLASLRESHQQPSREGGLRGLCISAPRDQRRPGLPGGRLMESVQKGGCDWQQGRQGSGGGVLLRGPSSRLACGWSHILPSSPSRHKAHTWGQESSISHSFRNLEEKEAAYRTCQKPTGQLSAPEPVALSDRMHPSEDGPGLLRCPHHAGVACRSSVNRQLPGPTQEPQPSWWGQEGGQWPRQEAENRPWPVQDPPSSPLLLRGLPDPRTLTAHKDLKGALPLPAQHQEENALKMFLFN